MIRELGLLAGWLLDQALDRIAPLPPPFFAPGPAERLADAEADYEVAEPVGEYPPLHPDQFTPDVPAGGVDAAALPPVAADKSAAGGHPIESTSMLLRGAAATLQTCYVVLSRDDLDYQLLKDRVLALLPRLRERAVQLDGEEP